jgi:hypothetical protein
LPRARRQGAAAGAAAKAEAATEAAPAAAEAEVEVVADRAAGRVVVVAPAEAAVVVGRVAAVGLAVRFRDSRFRLRSRVGVSRCW